MEAGVDSLAATELSSRLRTLTGVALSWTIVFDHPTAFAIAAHLLEHVSDADLESAVPAAPRVSLRSDLHVACDASICKQAAPCWQVEGARAHDDGFVGVVQCFHARAFGVSAAEAASGQRLLENYCWRQCHTRERAQPRRELRRRERVDARLHQRRLSKEGGCFSSTRFAHDAHHGLQVHTRL